jgi:Protein of unknown function (DUF3800)
MALFAFLDESGEYTFHARSGSYLIYAGIITSSPTLFTHDLASLKYDLLTQGKCLECFHACEDEQVVRDKVFEVICSSSEFEIHSVIVRKNRINPSLRKFGVYSVAYRTMLKYLVGSGRIKQVHIIVDTPPDKRQQTALKNTLRKKAEEIMTKQGVSYSIDHHRSSSHAMLQVADYCAWAIQKKWQSGNLRSYNLIKNRIRNEFDMYRGGEKEYY